MDSVVTILKQQLPHSHETKWTCSGSPWIHVISITVSNWYHASVCSYASSYQKPNPFYHTCGQWWPCLWRHFHWLRNKIGDHTEMFHLCPLPYKILDPPSTGNSNLLAHFGRTTRTLFTSERSHGREGQGAGIESYTCANSEQPTNPFRVNDDIPSIWVDRSKMEEGNRCRNQINCWGLFQFTR